jgi:hypothetical protein
MFEKIIKSKVRFNNLGLGGMPTAEDIYDLDKETLADMEVKQQEIVEKYGKQNRFVRKNDKLAIEELKLKFITHVIDYKIAEEEESANATAKKAELNKALEIRSKVNQSSLEEKIKNMTDEEFAEYTASLK